MADSYCSHALLLLCFRHPNDMRQWNLTQIEACCAKNVTPFGIDLLKISLCTLTRLVHKKEPKLFCRV